jgi:hypothetical protein
MATVTGLTAERMLEIEAASVVDGDVIGGELILTRQDGTPINAGVVQGPAGSQGPAGPGVPNGGTTGQALVKTSNADQATGWSSITPAILTPVTTLPTTGLTNGMQRILTDSLTAPTWQWLCQYDTSISDANKWRVIGPLPLGVSGQASSYITAAWGTLCSITTPRAGVYRTKAWASANAVQGLGEVLRHVIAGSEVIRNINGLFLGTNHARFDHQGISTLAAGATLQIDRISNGSDGLHAAGQIEIIPVRII